MKQPRHEGDRAITATPNYWHFKAKKRSERAPAKPAAIPAWERYAKYLESGGTLGKQMKASSDLTVTPSWPTNHQRRFVRNVSMIVRTKTRGFSRGVRIKTVLCGLLHKNVYKDKRMTRPMAQASKISDRSSALSKIMSIAPTKRPIAPSLCRTAPRCFLLDIDQATAPSPPLSLSECFAIISLKLSLRFCTITKLIRHERFRLSLYSFSLSWSESAAQALFLIFDLTDRPSVSKKAASSLIDLLTPYESDLNHAPILI